MVTPTLVLPEDKRLLFAILYFFGWLGAIVMYLIAKDDKTQKFYAIQAFIYGLLLLVSFFTCIGYLIMWIYLLYVMYKIFTTGGHFVPYIHKWAMKYS